MRASTAPNPVFEWLNRAAAAADWGLPEAGPAAALLRLDASDWEPLGYCPVYDVLKSARAGGPAPWHNNIRSSQDPLTGLLALEVCISKPQTNPKPQTLTCDASSPDDVMPCLCIGRPAGPTPLPTRAHVTCTSSSNGSSLQIDRAVHTCPSALDCPS